jgi:hypothetical protein
MDTGKDESGSVDVLREVREVKILRDYFNELWACGRIGDAGVVKECINRVTNELA